MDAHLERLRAHVSVEAAKPGFRHHAWFVEHHLKLVERMAEELLLIYTDADADIVRVMVWMHDYGKILDYDNQYSRTQADGPGALESLGFDGGLIKVVMENIGLLDRKEEVDLRKAPIEVQIVSSADAAAHHVGPFMPLWWWEHPARPLEQLMGDQRAKTTKDWDRKMVLPEVRAAFEWRHRAVLEQAGELPERFF